MPEIVSRAYEGKKLEFGREYIIPTPFDPRLIYEVPMAVAKAAMESGVANTPIQDWAEYKFQLRMRIQHTYF